MDSLICLSIYLSLHTPPPPSPLTITKNLYLLFSRNLLHTPVIFVRFLCFLVATISPFFQPQPEALPTSEWHQTTCQEPFKIAARHEQHSYSIWSTDVLKIWQKTTWCLSCQEGPVWWRVLVQICNVNGALAVFFFFFNKASK